MSRISRSSILGALAAVLALAFGSAGTPSARAGTPPAPPAPAGQRSVLFHGGTIRTNDGRGGLVEALLVRDGVVAAIGALADLERDPASAGWERVDLAGGFAVPGLQDAHGRLEHYGETLEQLDLRDVASYEELVQRVVEHARELPDGAWVRGFGWDQEAWSDNQMPLHRRLSDALPGRPVALERIDGHALLVNSRVLSLLKLDGRINPPPRISGGRVLIDAKGFATGVFVDQAMDLVEQIMPAPDARDTARRLLAAQERLLAYGLTCVHDMGVRPETIDVLRELRASGELRLRVVGYMAGNGRLSGDMLEVLPLLDPRDRLSVIGVSFDFDGSLGSRGAALLEDYSDAPGERGHLLLSRDDLARRIALVTGDGLQPTVQAVGDRANRIVLDIYSELDSVWDGFRSLRPRIEHGQVVTPKDWPRFPKLGVVPSMQPARAAADLGWVSERLGVDRARGAYDWRSLAPELGKLAFGSDFPSDTPDPLRGLYAARTRQAGQDGSGAERLLDGVAALSGYTIGAAYAAHQEDRRGRLIPGFACDMTVLDRDPVTCEPEALLAGRVLLTVIDGEVVYRAPR